MESLRRFYVFSTISSVQDSSLKCFDPKSRDAIEQTGLEKYLDCDSELLLPSIILGMQRHLMLLKNEIKNNK